MVAGTAPWIWMILTPGVEEGVHVVPLVDLAGQLALLSPGAAVVQIGGNLLVFAALGAMLPVCPRASALPRRWPPSRPPLRSPSSSSSSACGSAG